MFRPANTFTDPASGSNAQRGYPEVGAGQQTTGDPRTYNGAQTPIAPLRPTKGMRSWFKPASGENAQRGYPAPGDGAQIRPNGSMPNVVVPYGMPIPVETPYYDRGAAAYVQNFGKVLVNPIGAGIVALNRPQASYGGAAQYDDAALWWTSQVVPTSINLQGLTDPEALNEILGETLVQAVVRTTG